MIPESVEKITNRILFCSNCTSTSATLFEIQKIAPRNHAQNQNKKTLFKGTEGTNKGLKQRGQGGVARDDVDGGCSGLDSHALQVPGMAANAFSLFCL